MRHSWDADWSADHQMESRLSTFDWRYTNPKLYKKQTNHSKTYTDQPQSRLNKPEWTKLIQSQRYLLEKIARNANKVGKKPKIEIPEKKLLHKTKWRETCKTKRRLTTSARSRTTVTPCSQQSTPSQRHTDQHQNTLHTHARTKATRPQHQLAKKRAQNANTDGQQQNAVKPTKKQLYKTKHICTEIKSGGLRKPQARSSRHHGNPNIKLLPPPKKSHNRKYRTLTAKLRKAIKLAPLIPPKHQHSLPHPPSPLTSLTSHNFTYRSLANYALSRQVYMLHISATSPREHRCAARSTSTGVVEILLDDIGDWTTHNYWNTCSLT